MFSLYFYFSTILPDSLSAFKGLIISIFPEYNSKTRAEFQSQLSMWALGTSWSGFEAVKCPDAGG
jgi:hypothetical protein